MTESNKISNSLNNKNVCSPFYVVEEFVSPQNCERILDLCNFTVPNVDKDENEVLTVKSCEMAENLIFSQILPLIPELEQWYNLKYKGTEHIMFEWYPQGVQGTFECENSNFLRGKWLRTKQRDLTGVLFLTDYQDKTPFEHEYEAYGGRLEFVQHQFSFQPKRGTLIIFPSDPHFINITSAVLAGDYFQARIQIAADVPYIYQPDKFQGNFASWFEPYLSNR